MMRTAKYETLRLNPGKMARLTAEVRAYAKEKDWYLVFLGRTSNWSYLDRPGRDLRDEVPHAHTLPVHLHDQAAFDARDTMIRYIEGGLALSHLRARLFQDLAGEQQHYAFWVLRSYERMGQVLGGRRPEPPFSLGVKEQKAVVRYLRRRLRKALGKRPRVKLKRSMSLDTTLYQIFESQAKQGTVVRTYALVSSPEHRKRIALPLSGKGRIDGNVRLVLHPERGTVAIHMQYDVRAQKATSGEVVGLDAGVTEVLATSGGEKLGPGFGQVLDRLTKETTSQGAARHHLRQGAEKAEIQGDPAKARRMRRYNLGLGKLHRRRQKGEAEVKRRVGEVVREALADAPSVVVVEDLSHMRGRTKSRKLSRIVSRWMRSSLRERLEFRTEAGGSRLVTLSAAYTSQTCPDPTCGFVHKDNRHGDRFQCLQCGYAGDADVIAALNIAARMDDPDIHVWTPKEKVREILMARFRRRKETATRDAPAAAMAAAVGQSRQEAAAPPGAVRMTRGASMTETVTAPGRTPA